MSRLKILALMLPPCMLFSASYSGPGWGEQGCPQAGAD
jgi:hypothetical protein